MKKYKLQYVALAVAMGLSFSSSALVQDINTVTPEDQKKALAYDFKNDTAYIRVKTGVWEKLGVDPDEAKAKIVGRNEVKNFSIIDEKLPIKNEKNAQNAQKILIKTVEDVKELDRFLGKNMSDTATNKRNLTNLQDSHNNLDKRVTGLTERVTGLTDFVTDEMDIVDDKFTKQDAKFTALNQELNDKIDANKRDTDKSIELAYDNIDEHEKQIRHLNSKTDQMLENDQNLMTGLRSLATETEKGFNRFEAQNQELKQGVARLDGQVEMANQNIQDHKKSIDELKTNQGHMWGLFGAVANNAAKANNNAANVAKLDAKTDKMLENDQNLMTGLKSLAAETEKGFNRFEAQNQKLEQGVANLEGRVEMTEQGVARLNGRVEMTEQGVAKLDGRVKMTEQGVAKLDGRVKMTEQNIDKLMPQINRNALDLKNIREDVRSLKKDAKAGIASAVALGMLPQSTLPGKSLMSLGVGHHRGQNAFALGVSTMSENNKWVAKGGMSYDTQKNVSLGGSVGFFFN